MNCLPHEKLVHQKNKNYECPGYNEIQTRFTWSDHTGCLAANIDWLVKVGSTIDDLAEDGSQL
jgi:hypothetical protein